MPSLRDSIDSAKGLTKIPMPTPTVISVQPIIPSENANQRFILPPFNADPDSVRQFEGTSPKIRIWPSPQSQGGGTGTTTTNEFVNANVSSSSSSSTTIIETVTLTPMTVSVTTGSLPAGSNYQATLAMSRTFQLLSLTANAGCEVRLYGTQQAQIFDASRPTGNPVPPEISQNIITCVTLDTAPYFWVWQNRSGVNGNTPATPQAYVTIFNTVPTSAAPVTVSIQFLALEV